MSSGNVLGKGSRRICMARVSVNYAKLEVIRLLVAFLEGICQRLLLRTSGVLFAERQVMRDVTYNLLFKEILQIL